MSKFMGVKVVVTNIFATEERSVVVDGVGLGYYRAVDLERTAFLRVHFTYLDADGNVGRRLSGEKTPRANMGVQFLSSKLDAVHRFGTMLVRFQFYLGKLFAEVVGDAVADPFLKCAVGFETDETANEASEYVLIPMKGEVESMNAATSSAILTFEASRQRRG